MRKERSPLLLIQKSGCVLCEDTPRATKLGASEVEVSAVSGVGSTVGSNEGSMLGSKVGSSVGSFVGICEGDFVGAEEGIGDGELVGIDEGDFVGIGVGSGLGTEVGVVVGATVGVWASIQLKRIHDDTSSRSNDAIVPTSVKAREIFQELTEVLKTSSNNVHF